MHVHEVRPPGPTSAVVLLHEAWGVTPYTRDVADSLAAAGHHVLAPDLLHRDPESHPIPYGELRRLLPAIERMSDDNVLRDVDAVRGELEAIGWSDTETGVVGFCLGGRMAFLVALTWSLGASVSFYPGGVVTSTFPNLPALIPRVSDLCSPWLGIFGDADATIPVEDVERLDRALDPVDHLVEIVRYPGAEHAFHNSRRDSFAPEAAADAWARALAWLDRHLART